MKKIKTITKPELSQKELFRLSKSYKKRFENFFMNRMIFKTIMPTSLFNDLESAFKQDLIESKRLHKQDFIFKEK